MGQIVNFTKKNCIARLDTRTPLSYLTLRYFHLYHAFNNFFGEFATITILLWFHDGLFNLKKKKNTKKKMRTFTVNFGEGVH